MTPGYVLIAATSSRPASIVCLTCGLQSFNINDIGWHYCGHCHRFHDDVVETVALLRDASLAPSRRRRTGGR